MHPTLKTTLKDLLMWGLMILTFIIAGTLCSRCQSKSGQLPIAEAEKVVIINEAQITYKVKRIEQGTIDYITIPDYYIPGDTILVTFE